MLIEDSIANLNSYCNIQPKMDYLAAEMYGKLINFFVRIQQQYLYTCASDAKKLGLEYIASNELLLANPAGNAGKGDLFEATGRPLFFDFPEPTELVLVCLTGCEKRIMKIKNYIKM